MSSSSQEIPISIELLWQEAFDLGYEHPDPSRWAIWKETCNKWDNTQPLGTWKVPSDRDIQHMQSSMGYLRNMDPNSWDYVCWFIGCQTNRIRAPQSVGGFDLPATAQALAELAFNLGGIGGIRVTPTSHLAPPITNYIVFGTSDDSE